MKTRVIHTRFWQDNFVMGLSIESRLLFNYLLTNQYINISGIYELPDRIIIMETGLSSEQLERGKTDLSPKVLFKDGWIRVVNVDKYNSYRNSPKNEIAYKRELETAPEQLKSYPNDTSIHTSMDTPINHKSEIINHKSEINNGESEKLEGGLAGILEKKKQLLQEQKPKQGGITKSWQDQAFRFAEALGIELTDEEGIKSRWLKLFKDADSNIFLSGKIQSTYGYLIDYPPFNKLTDPVHKAKYFFKMIYGREN